MLILSRRNGQSIRIGDDIIITVLELGRDQVRIGVHAPRSTAVHREEVYEEIMLANQAAAGGDPAAGFEAGFETVSHPGETVIAITGSNLGQRPQRAAL